MMLSVVMPAYNEASVIAETVRALAGELDRQDFPYEILVVNDASRDATEAVLVELERSFAHLRHVNNPGPHGYGCAVRHGLAHFRGDAVVVAMAVASTSRIPLPKALKSLCRWKKRSAATKARPSPPSSVWLAAMWC